MIVGLILALGSALGTNVAFLFKHRGAVLAPPIRVRHPLRSAADLFSSRWFAIGWLVAIFAWGLHVGALALAPLSIVQAVLSGGLVFLAVLAERFFGFDLGRRQWVGVIITAAGLSSGIDGALHVIEKLYGKGTAQLAAVGMEYDWRPDSGWARASLADMQLFPAFAAVGEYPRRVVKHEGTKDRWETSWKVTTTTSAQTLQENMDKAFGEAGWKRQGPGAFRYEGDGGRWTETTRVEAARGSSEKAYIVTTTVARAN